jgi:acyl transferase domain-containing protein/surfactin synthase thioesterase subunit
MAGTDVAIIGMACRFPGADDPEAFWANLCAGVESIRVFSPDELRAAGVDDEERLAPGYVPAAPVLADVEAFDAAFFGCPPREARLLDPQHRLFLETCWAALEDAGYRPDRPRAVTGVFAGAGGNVSSWLLAHHREHPDLLGPTGSLEHLASDKDFLATRVSYQLNLTGPSLTVQTACSTSLVAVHLACRSILDGECDLALAGGAAVRFPHGAGYRSEKGGILSPDGHCRAFDARAEGTVFGSGVGAVLLKGLDRARADGDHVYAVIKATAVNNDGGDKLSYTTSSVEGQARAIAEALALAGVPGDSLGYVECHGTGTAVGDPLELQALARGFGPAGPGARCAIGSVKTNIGHLEQAAGVAGLIKAALVLDRQEIPPSLWLETPSPRIDWQGGRFAVCTARTPWPAGPAPRRVGVNALGLGGTNAFAVLEEAPAPERVAGTVAERPAHLLALGARSPAALTAAAQRLAAHVRRNPAEGLGDVCFTASTSRSGGRERLAVVAASGEELADALARAPAPVLAGSGTPSKLAFLFPGQGAQVWAMGRQLHDAHPVFRAALDRIAGQLDRWLPVPALSVLFGPDDGRLHRTELTQPLLFAVQLALAQLWRTWGVTPDAVVGHSVGELAAACALEMIPLDDACRFVVRRAAHMGALPAGGGMLSLFAPAAVAAELIAGRQARVAIAADNAPEQTVVSGPLADLEAIAAEARRRGLAARRLRVSHAFHSPLVEPALEAIAADAAAMGHDPRAAARLYTNLTGAPRPGGLDATYWAQQVRRPVLFRQAMMGLAAAGVRTFVELGPGRTLLDLGKRCLPGLADDAGATWCASLACPPRRQTGVGTPGGPGGELRAALQALGAVFTAGHEVDWFAFDAPWPRRRVRLPTYPFQRTRFGLPPARAPRAPRRGHPLAGEPQPSPLEGAAFEATYDRTALPWIEDHQIHGLPVLPTAAALEAVRAAAARHLGSDEVALEDVVYREALLVPDEGGRVVQILFAADGGFRLFSRPADERAGWRLHLLGRARQAEAALLETVDLAAVATRCPRLVEPDAFYRAAAAEGLGYGPGFRGIRELRLGDGEALTRVQLPDGLDAGALALHPALLDASLHVYAALAPDGGQAGQSAAHLPVGLSRFQLLRPHARDVRVHARRRLRADGFVVDLSLLTPTGELVAELQGLSLRRLPPAALSPRPAFQDWLYQVSWRPVPAQPAAAPSPTRWLILADEAGLGAALARCLAASGDEVQVRRRSEGLPDLTAADRLVYLWGLDDAARAGTVDALAVLRGVPALAARVTLVTRAAWAVGGATADPHQAQLWGLGRSAAHELGRAWDGLIDLAPDTDADALAAALRDPTREPEVALRDGGRQVPRLHRLQLEHDLGPRIVPDATYIVTGGLGALGAVVVQWLRDAGARHITVLTRTPRAAPADGADLQLLAGDVAVVDDVARTVAGIDPRFPLRGVFHCAGLLDDGVLARMTPEQLDRVLRPKVDGAHNLHRATRDHPLDHFVLFSSVLSVTGSAGQANYTAGNAYLDALAASRQAEGRPALVINWGPWAGSGIATTSGKRGQEIWQARGTRYIPPAEGSRVLDHLLRRGAASAVVTITDWTRYLQAFETVPPLYAELATAISRRAPDPLIGLRQQLAAASGDARRPLARQIVARCAAAVLGLDGPAPEDRPLADLGLDSLMAVALASRLEASLQQPVAMARLLEGPSVAALVDELFPASSAARERPARARAPAADWVVRLQPREAPRARLLCFPFAGGGSALFRAWADHLGPEVEVLAIEPPGRLRRIREAPVRSIAAFIDGLVQALGRWLDRPYAGFGHCLGGLTMLETMRALRAADQPLPARLFAAGARPPHRVMRPGRFERELARQLTRHPEFDETRALHEQPTAVFTDVVRAFRIDASEQLLADTELRDLMFPTIRAEFQMASEYVFAPLPPFPCPLTVFFGRDDPYVSRDDALAWGRFTESEFRVHTRPGAHFLLAEDSRFILDTIGQSLATLS